MRRALTLGVLLMVTACGTTTTVATIASPSPSAQQQFQRSPQATASPSPGTGTKVPSPSPSPQPTVACKTGSSSASAMVMIGGFYGSNHLIYDVSDPLHPKLVCSISGTSAHLFTGDTVVYLKPVAANETDVMLHSIGSGNESKAASFPVNVTDPIAGDIREVAWTPDGSLLAYAVPDETTYVVHVWLYSQGKAKLVHDYGLGIGDCICRFGLPPAVLAFSPDGQYLADGQLAGKGSTAFTVVRVSDGATVFTAGDTGSSWALWGRTGHQLYLVGLAGGLKSWTPESGLQAMPGNAWSFVAGVSPDGTTVAYTAYSDPDTQVQPRVYTYDLKSKQARILIDKLRTQVLFIKDGWVWYLEERSCDQATEGCPGSTAPTGNVFAMQLSTGVEQPVTFAAGENPISTYNWLVFTPGDFWPNS